MVLCCWTELQSQVRDIAEALLVVGVTWVNPNLINIKDFFCKYNLIPVLSSYWGPLHAFPALYGASNVLNQASKLRQIGKMHEIKDKFYLR